MSFELYELPNGGGQVRLSEAHAASIGATRVTDQRTDLERRADEAGAMAVKPGWTDDDV